MSAFLLWRWVYGLILSNLPTIGFVHRVFKLGIPTQIACHRPAFSTNTLVPTHLQNANITLTIFVKMKDFVFKYLLQVFIKLIKWRLIPHLCFLIFIKNQSLFFNSKPFVSNEHLKLTYSMVIFGSFLVQHINKFVELDIKLMAIRRGILWSYSQLLILKIEHMMSGF